MNETNENSTIILKSHSYTLSTFTKCLFNFYLIYFVKRISNARGYLSATVGVYEFYVFAVIALHVDMLIKYFYLFLEEKINQSQSQLNFLLQNSPRKAL